MTARGFDYYDQMTAAVRPSPTPQAPTSTAAPQAAAAATRGSDRLMRAGAYLLVFVGIMFLAAFLIAVTPLGAIDADITVPFVAAVLGGLGVIAWAVLR